MEPEDFQPIILALNHQPSKTNHINPQFTPPPSKSHIITLPHIKPIPLPKLETLKRNIPLLRSLCNKKSSFPELKLIPNDLITHSLTTQQQDNLWELEAFS